jgi:hypothetical protein
MARVLLVGQQPETVDFTSPTLPPDMNAERIHAGIMVAMKVRERASYRLRRVVRLPSPQPQDRARCGRAADVIVSTTIRKQKI